MGWVDVVEREGVERVERGYTQEKVGPERWGKEARMRLLVDVVVVEMMGRRELCGGCDRWTGHGVAMSWYLGPATMRQGKGHGSRRWRGEEEGDGKKGVKRNSDGVVF